MLAAFWDRYSFSLGGVDFHWIDAALAAMARGEWPAFERRLAESLACAARATAEHAPPSQNALDRAETAFRYDRDLISGADTTAWLERVGLSADEWVAFLSRGVLRQQWVDELDDILDEFAPSARQLVDAAVAEGICSGAFEAFERILAGRAALVLETDAALFLRATDREDVSPSVAAAAAQLARTHAHWLSMRPADDTASRLATVLRLDAAFETLIDRIVSNGRLREIVEANRLEWIRLELDTVSFPSETAAREAILCVTEDGLSLSEVAALSHRAVERATMALEDVDPAHRDLLLAAEPGRVLGPLAVEDRFDIAALVSRTAPALSDPAVAARARQTLLDSALHHAARGHVTRRRQA